MIAIIKIFIIKRRPSFSLHDCYKRVLRTFNCSKIHLIWQ